MPQRISPSYVQTKQTFLHHSFRQGRSTLLAWVLQLFDILSIAVQFAGALGIALGLPEDPQPGGISTTPISSAGQMYGQSCRVGMPSSSAMPRAGQHIGGRAEDGQLLQHPGSTSTG